MLRMYERKIITRVTSALLYSTHMVRDKSENDMTYCIISVTKATYPKVNIFTELPATVVLLTCSLGHELNAEVC